MQEKVTLKITSGARSGIDVSYWESLATELKGFKARVSLQEKHKELMTRIDLAHETKRKKEKQGNKFSKISVR